MGYAPTEGFQVKRNENEYKTVAKVQGGHMYIRVDDFGEQTNRHCGADSALKVFSTRKEQARKGMQPLERAIFRRTIEGMRVCEAIPGEVFFPQSVPILPRDRPEHLQIQKGHGEHASGVSGEGHFPRLIRVSSEPSMESFFGFDVPPEDISWANTVIGRSGSRGSPVSLSPPSAAALRVVLHHYNPLGTHLFGTANFKSIEDLYNEILEQTSYIVIDRNGALQRFVEPVILQLRFRGRLLMRTHELVEGCDEAAARNTFVSCQLAEDECWEQGLHNVLDEKLGIKQDVLRAHLEAFSADFANADLWHSVIEETKVSPSYPGLLCHYRTHMVTWEISEDSDLKVFSQYGLPINLEKRKKNPHNCDFETFLSPRYVNGRSKTLYWTWMPEVEARKLQDWVNIGDATRDEMWARQAFQKEGAVQFPPTETALVYLLQRCGIDVQSFGSGPCSLNSLWRELTNQEGILYMHAGQPTLAMEAIQVRVRRKRNTSSDILAQVREENPDGSVNENCKLLQGRKLKEDSWSSAAMRCVTERLAVSRQQVISMLAHRPDDASEYTFVEEIQEASIFPGIKMLQRTHLVNYTFKDGIDVMQASSGETVGNQLTVSYNAGLGDDYGSSSEHLPPSPSGRSFMMRQMSQVSESSDELPFTALLTDKDKLRSRGSRRLRVINYQWMAESKHLINDVIGMKLFDEADKKQEVKRISSVLIGLEGADPGNVSVFGMGHDASGASSKVSASGGRKWRAYRTNNALQIPADIGGMRMTVTEQNFKELIETCEQVDLLDPNLDILWEPGVAYPRALLDHRNAEKEFFKQILAGSGLQAHKAVEWMKAYRHKHKTPAQFHRALGRRRSILQRSGPLRRSEAGVSTSEECSSPTTTKAESDRFDLSRLLELSQGSHDLEGDIADYQVCVSSSDPTLPSEPMGRMPILTSCRSPAAASRIFPCDVQTTPSLPRAGAGARRGCSELRI
jgi:hypothetical protein